MCCGKNALDKGLGMILYLNQAKGNNFPKNIITMIFAFENLGICEMMHKRRVVPYGSR
jgi:hypothetical protein